MKRHLCVTALAAMVLVPDWATACWPRWGGPVYSDAYYEPVYYAPPPVYYVVPPVYAVPCPPVAAPTLAPAPAPKPPQVESSTPKVGRAPAAVAPVRPVAAAEPAPPEVTIPKNTTSDAKLPPLQVPIKPDAELKLPPVAVPTGAEPKLPSLDFPGVAVPVPAPSPDVLVPPAAKSPDALPPLSLPPDAPVAPDKPVQAKSSPLTAATAFTVSVFPAAGTAPAAGLRKVGFYNHTPRDLALTIEGKPVTLPAMSYLHAQLPAAFTWKCADRPAATERVPADAAGVDVLIRE